MSDIPVTSSALPQHIAIIMDGNGRWAKLRGKPRVYGHKKGVSAVRKTITAAAKLGVKSVTLFAFSSENWRRPEEEVSLLMELFITLLTTEVKRLHKNDLKLRIIGDKSGFNSRLQKKIAEAEVLTQDNTGLVINVAANYGGKWDITQATKRIAEKALRGEIQPADITEQLISQEVCLADLPEVDLLIRTSGESRLSNFLLWQVAYAEFYFCEKHWPDFDEDGLAEAISWYVNRERRFGCTGDQIKALMDNK
ncbi:isoprenyl transferase [Vibrio breoganii]|uniref:isoprenyl transferase n=1 Tax=Vibrio breoganii TaxID=553239 RepID=UPI000C82750F|nr:isoprenyl transferase [Vibrio breoganii]PMG93724.1 di-trans,poly-cis-decaprenylcistransferase [Vibrio breoganii]PMK20490.1 di-trans,poly-cis-decaprenylcistransferase [Vibrio breoganii]PMP01923.1 di-trans,poly-cis-decaprenylcistransferase [Vibrio breoganii]TKG32306.1 isoprenyl transferase [Vibrio breoganii]